NRVWTTFWNPEHGWNSWFQIHPETVFDHTVQKITAVARKPDQIDLFAIGFDNAVWTTFWNPEHGWNSWFQIHPETVFDHTVQKITAVARKPDQIDLFAIGFDDRVWTTFWNPQNSWNPWFQIHPETVFDHHAQSISAVARMPDQIDLFTIGFDDRVWTTFWNPQNGWNPWFQIHRETAFDHSRQKITAVARKSEQLDLFTIGFDDRVWTTFWNPQNGWNPWFQIHPETVFDHSRQEITGLARKSEQLDLFTIGFDDRVWTAFWNPA
ncbi:hypothetical protein AB0F03_36215, partial [Streptomyces sp. NPDC028722]|uniref:hypothetical protein n=1 Tax=Streptomyces sp. NPDC028722 TaxID=3155016 RepID=UPI0033D70D53